MFRQLNRRVNPESGMVLVTVLMIVGVMMILSIAILSQNVTQSTTSQQQIEQILGEQLARGIFWNTYSACLTNSACTAFAPGNYSLGNYNGKPYTANNELNSLLAEDLDFMVCNYLTSKSAWFVTAEKDQHQIKFFDRHPIDTDYDDDFDTRATKVITFQAFAAGATSWEGTFGSNGP